MKQSLPVKAHPPNDKLQRRQTETLVQNQLQSKVSDNHVCRYSSPVRTGSPELSSSRPSSNKLLSDLFKIKTGMQELEESNQRVVDKIHEKVAKSRSIIKEESDILRLLG